MWWKNCPTEWIRFWETEEFVFQAVNGSESCWPEYCLGTRRLIVMDEATSAMDYESEMAVRNAIRDLKEQVTILIIAHRLATVRTAKYGLVLEAGKITESGTLRELASYPEGYFSRLLCID